MVTEIKANGKLRKIEKHILFWKNVSEVRDIVKELALQPCYKFTAQKFENRYEILKTLNIKKLQK